MLIYEYKTLKALIRLRGFLWGPLHLLDGLWWELLLNGHKKPPIKQRSKKYWSVLHKWYVSIMVQGAEPVFICPIRYIFFRSQQSSTRFSCPIESAEADQSQSPAGYRTMRSSRFLVMSCHLRTRFLGDRVAEIVQEAFFCGWLPWSFPFL